VVLHVDHIVPRYKAPHRSLDIENLQVLCRDCNIGKGAWDQTDWRQHFKSI
jgi:5-methylcytosine-specific restriction endonuclease McrA